ncbi:hypothetical protein SCP_0806100 [Sparassis crispa]|uniref:F-box domain-containing protein n=1 Tax=Sparassis crispa TaxID=139825 RepID=A0A401GV65_9APHY|nr:hypothetical protein SCP_0806100 [Sparassis crispa]GBE86086.1 hypothetical protein SCP_0806100 [Sparassis crispa]
MAGDRKNDTAIAAEKALCRVGALGSMSTSAARTLSAELLAGIFHLLSVDCGYMEWIRVLEVCRRWRTVGLGVSALWTDIHVAKNLPFVNFCLKNSGDMLVNIFSEEDDAVSDLAGVINSISAIGLRIRSLRWESSDLETLVQSLDFDMPRLTQLALGAESGRRPDKKFFWNPRSDQYPSLCSLSLAAVDIQWSYPPFSSLVNLRLARLTRPDTVDEFLDFLQISPALETLHVDYSAPSVVENLQIMDWVGEEPDIPPPTRTLSLLKLRRLHLGDTTFNVKWLLSHMSIPTGTTLSFTYPLEVGVD